jgi:rhodanese-related sulfurtransferase
LAQAPVNTGVEPATLSEQLCSVTVLDVRSPAEFESAHIPGSFNLPLDRLPACTQDIESIVANPVVLVCRSGQRAKHAERELQGADLCGVQVLEGGLGAWEGAGLPLTRGKQRWSMERQVRGVAGTLVLAGIAASLKFKPLAMLSAAVGGGLLYSAVSDTCTMANVLGKLPYNQGVGCDVSQVLRDIASRQPTVAPEAE